MAYKIRPRAGSAAEWAEANPVLAEREIGYEFPANGVGTGYVNMKMGDGVTPWNDLPYAVGSVVEVSVVGKKLIINTNVADADEVSY